MQDETFEFVKGNCPILISMPHNGIQIPRHILSTMTGSAKKMVDTDWYLDQLYQFAMDNGCYLINPKFSRYVIDLNRPEDDQNLYPGQDTTELCPTTQFDRQPIYLPNCDPTAEDIRHRVKKYWQPYHRKLKSIITEIKSEFGCALLFEAHSIKSKVPRFFDGLLPDFNFGDYNHHSCSPNLINKIDDWQLKGYTKVVNGRFKGGYITRAYGEPDSNIHAIQLELSQATYMDESKLSFDQSKANQVQLKLVEMFELFNSFIQQNSKL
jgi:N-formylglutamate deformylase